MAKEKRKRAPKPLKIHPINNFIMLLFLNIFQALTGLSAALSVDKDGMQIVLAIGLFIVIEWVYLIVFYTAFHRRNFELEFIAFFLCSVGLCVIGSITPAAALRQLLMIVAGILVHIFLVFLMGNVDLCMKLRLPAAIGALLLMALNIILAETTNGAYNWIQIGGENSGITFQPSEFVKVAFIFVGAATLEKIQTTKNIWAFLIFACLCVGSMFVIRDFGAALIFFVTFLILAFMNSGDIRTVIYSVAAAGLGAGIIVRYRPYVTERFATYRHVFEDPYGGGQQQTRVLVGLASGGLLGLGIGQGFVRNVYASTSDLVFGVICEEWGLLFGLIVVLSFVGIAVSALKNSIASKSAFYSITAVAGAGMLLFQAALNIFGITDILPLTGVTLPFVSQGGSSIISCWAILAFIKASDVRTYNSGGGQVHRKGGARQR